MTGQPSEHDMAELAVKIEALKEQFVAAASADRRPRQQWYVHVDTKGGKVVVGPAPTAFAAVQAAARYLDDWGEKNANELITEILIESEVCR